MFFFFGVVRLAALEGHYDVVQILISHDADLDSKDADGRSTLYVLALDNRLAMSKYFIQQGADVETRDLEVSYFYDSPCVSFLFVIAFCFEQKHVLTGFSFKKKNYFLK